MIADLVNQIGREYVDTITLIKGELDPHSYQLVKGDDEKLRFAQLIFYNGLTLEHGPSLREYLQKSPTSVGLGDRIKMDHPELILDYNGQLDPHIWMDISLWAKTIPYIVEGLIAIQPEHAQYFKANGEALLNEMLDVHKKMIASMHEIPENKRYLVTSHDAFNYFARAYLRAENEHDKIDWQKRFAAPEGLSPDSQLSTTDIQFIINYMKTHDIQVLFPESNVSQDSIRKILSAGNEYGLHLIIATPFLYADAMGEPGSSGDTYLKMIQHDVKLIKLHLNDNQPTIVNGK